MYGRGRTRTSDLRLVRAALSPAELRALGLKILKENQMSFKFPSGGMRMFENYPSNHHMRGRGIKIRMWRISFKFIVEEIEGVLRSEEIAGKSPHYSILYYNAY